MSKFRFRPDDFKFEVHHDASAAIAVSVAEQANKLLQEAEEQCEPVFGRPGQMKGWGWTKRRGHDDTHTALIWNRGLITKEK